MEDITIRALNTLKFVDVVFAEDTREAYNLLKHYDISKKIESCHKYSEMKHKDKIIRMLKEGKNIGYVTDRGTPLISDPGNYIVNEVIKEEISVIALPGATALIPALNMSGLDNSKFLFYGFLNSKKTLAEKELKNLKNVNYSLIFYESPYRVKNTLELIYKILGDRKIALVREISKLHEEIIRENISEVIKYTDTLKGEFVIVVEKNHKIIEDQVDCKNIVNEMYQKGYTKKDAIKEVSKRYNISKNKLYEECKEL